MIAIVEHAQIPRSLSTNIDVLQVGSPPLTDDASIRPSSRIRRRVDAGETVYEKQYTTDDWEGSAELIRSRAAREIRLLQSMHASSLFGGRLGVVQVVRCDPQQATIATREVSGQTLTEWLLNRHPRRHSLRPWYIAGRWLRTLQELPVPDFAYDRLSGQSPSGLVDYCDLRLRSMRDLGYHWPSKEVHCRLLRVLEDLENRSEPWTRQTVWAHGDYAPSNLIWGHGILTPIDFATARAGGALDDAAYLIHRLEMHRVYRPWLRLPMAAMRGAILRGLGHPEASSFARYKALMIRNLICRLHTYVWRPPARLRQSVHNRWVRAVVRHRLHRAASGDSTSFW